MTERKVSSESVSEDFVEQVAKEIAKHTYARCLPQMSDCEDWDAMEEADRKIYRAAAEAVLAPLSQASSVIAGLKAEVADLRDEWQAEYDARLAANTARRAAETRISSLEQANEALRSERITAERDALDAYGKLQTAEARISSLEEENKRLREALDISLIGCGE